MEVFLAYFDVLGFKEFIDNSKPEIRERLMNNLMRDSQLAMTQDKTVEHGGVLIPDLSQAKVHCLHVSDSIVFWTDGLSAENFSDIVLCSSLFLMRCIQMTFPVRGCIVAGEISFSPFTIKNENSHFYNSSLYGKALIDGYLKAESQDWVGCYIDRSAISKVEEKHVDELIYSNRIVYYPVPFKDGTSSYEYALRTIPRTINNVYFKNLAKSIVEVFERHTNGKPLPDSVRQKLTNTIKFYDYFRQNSIPETPTS